MRARQPKPASPLVALPLWYDVDDGATLRVLAAELLDGTRPVFAAVHGYNAVNTRAFLQDLAKGGNAPWNAPASGTTAS